VGEPILFSIPSLQKIEFLAVKKHPISLAMFKITDFRQPHPYLDLSIKCSDGQTIYFSAILLSIESSACAIILGGGPWAENCEKKIELNEITSDQMVRVAEFIFANHCPDSGFHGYLINEDLDLLPAIDIYDFWRLKNSIIPILKQNHKPAYFGFAKRFLSESDYQQYRENCMECEDSTSVEIVKFDHSEEFLITLFTNYDAKWILDTIRGAGITLTPEIVDHIDLDELDPADVKYVLTTSGIDLVDIIVRLSRASIGPFRLKNLAKK
jgi:BTB/POZ domain